MYNIFKLVFKKKIKSPNYGEPICEMVGYFRNTVKLLWYIIVPIFIDLY